MVHSGDQVILVDAFLDIRPERTGAHAVFSGKSSMIDAVCHRLRVNLFSDDENVLLLHRIAAEGIAVSAVFFRSPDGLHNLFSHIRADRQTDDVRRSGFGAHHLRRQQSGRGYADVDAGTIGMGQIVKGILHGKTAVDRQAGVGKCLPECGHVVPVGKIDRRDAEQVDAAGHLFLGRVGKAPDPFAQRQADTSGIQIKSVCRNRNNRYAGTLLDQVGHTFIVEGDDMRNGRAAEHDKARMQVA